MHSSFPALRDLYEASMEELRASFDQCDPLLPAMAWIRAENMREIYFIVRRWAVMIENELVEDHNLQMNTDERGGYDYWLDQTNYDRLVFDFIQNLSHDEYLSPYFEQMLKLPYMPPNVRSAFAKEILARFKSMDAIRAEARNRISSGETFPP